MLDTICLFADKSRGLAVAFKKREGGRIKAEQNLNGKRAANSGVKGANCFKRIRENVAMEME